MQIVRGENGWPILAARVIPLWKACFGDSPTVVTAEYEGVSMLHDVAAKRNAATEGAVLCANLLLG